MGSNIVRILYFLILVPLLISSSMFEEYCPDACDCGLDQRGRIEVVCTQGRLLEVPTIKMSPQTEIIKLIPPPSQPNFLSIGRFFGQFKKLEELHIVNSNIPNIGEHSFWKVQSLRVLNLTNNNISLIIDSNFKGLVSLEKLSLAHNKIDSFVSASFTELVKLRELDLSWNRASKLVERLFFNLHQLEVLNLSGNWIRELTPDVFRDIWKLKELRCRSCGLKTINPLLYALIPDLVILDLGENEFRYLNRDEFGSLIHLRILYLDGNSLSAITDDTFRSIRLYKLSLGSNRIQRIDRNGFFNSTIGELDLSGNKFESLDHHIFSTLKRNMTSLDLSRNPKLRMTSLSILLTENPQLRILSLAGNRYVELPLDLFEKQRQLEVLNLSNNSLADIYPQQITPLNNLKILDLSFNKLKGMDGDVLQYVDRFYYFQDLRIQGNPWACDLCNIPILLKWLQLNPIYSNGCRESPYGPYCLRCNSPPKLYDKAIINLDESMLEWCNSAEPASILASDPRFSLFLGIGVILLVLVIAAVSVIVHSKWHAAHYYTHEEDRGPEIHTPPIPPDYDHLAINEGFDNLYYTDNGNGKAKMIATIEEITYEPKYNSNAVKKTNYPQLTSFKQQQAGGGTGNNSRPVSSSSPILQHHHITSSQSNINR